MNIIFWVQDVALKNIICLAIENGYGDIIKSLYDYYYLQKIIIE